MSTPQITYQTLDGSSISDPSEELLQFCEKNASWLAMGYSDDDGISYCLHPKHLEGCLNLFKINSADRETEKELASICDFNCAIGICQDRLIKYSLLQQPLVWPAELDLSGFLNLGWKQSDIATLKNISDPTTKINHRLRSAVGRLISMPSFLAARDKVRTSWLSLPPKVRPLLPIARSMRLPQEHKLSVEPVLASVADFIAEFDAFCGEWHLLGMATWRLPDPRGPNWVPGLADEKMLRDGNLVVSTPWHFHLLAEDGLGRVLEAEHRHQVSERGIEDGASWETYAHLLKLYFWELVLSSRYSQDQRIASFKTEMEFVLAEILGLTVNRIKRLRTCLSALRRGTVTSLAGKR